MMIKTTLTCALTLAFLTACAPSRNAAPSTATRARLTGLGRQLRRRAALRRLPGHPHARDPVRQRPLRKADPVPGPPAPARSRGRHLFVGIRRQHHPPGRLRRQPALLRRRNQLTQLYRDGTAPPARWRPLRATPHEIAAPKRPRAPQECMPAGRRTSPPQDAAPKRDATDPAPPVRTALGDLIQWLIIQGREPAKIWRRPPPPGLAGLASARAAAAVHAVAGARAARLVGGLVRRARPAACRRHSAEMASPVPRPRAGCRNRRSRSAATAWRRSWECPPPR